MKISEGERGTAMFFGAVFLGVAVLGFAASLWAHEGRMASTMVMLAISSGWLLRFGWDKR